MKKRIKMVGLLLLVLALGGCERYSHPYQPKKDPPPETPTLHAPIARAEYYPLLGSADSLYTVDLSTSRDAEDSTALLYRWDTDGDGFWDGGYSAQNKRQFRYATTGVKRLRIEIMDSDSMKDSIVVSFTVMEALGSVTDIDGNVYKTVKIGGRWWMAENLRTSRFRDGTPIPRLRNTKDWYNSFEDTVGYCIYESDESNVSAYGYLYDWWAVNHPSGLAPVGWHVASDSEWQALVDTLGGMYDAGGALKEGGWGFWRAPNIEGTNASGFTAMPGGLRRYSDYSDYYGEGEFGFYWTSTPDAHSEIRAWSRELNWFSGFVNRQLWHKGFGLSVRCVKDE